MKNYRAFTLAEVLITLSILGVVAAISIPNIIQQYQKRLTITKLQKAYANLEIAANNIAVNSGCIGRDIPCTGLFDITDDAKFRKKFFELSGFKIIKEKTNNFRIAYLICETKSCNSTNGVQPGTWISYISPDNIGYVINKKTINVSSDDKKENSIEVLVLTDTNKSKYGELRLGRNAFYFTIYGNFEVEPTFAGFGGNIFPLSSLGKTNWSSSDYLLKGCNPKTDYMAGLNCAARIIKDGWKMNY